MENGAREMMRWPSSSRKAKARYTNVARPRRRRTRETTRKAPFRLAAGAGFCGGEIVQNARMAGKYISVGQRAPDQPIFSELGVSFTIRIPINRRDNVRTTTWRMIFPRGSPLLRREPRAKGMDMP